MKNLHNIGRVFFGVAFAGIGFQTVYYNNLPYMLFPPVALHMPGFTYIIGVILILTGIGILIKKTARLTALLSGTVLLLIFCLWYVPYEFFMSHNYMHLSEWENAEKELALAGGMFAIAGCFAEKNKSPVSGFLDKLIPLGAYLFAVPMVSFGILHFLLAKEASTLVPVWIPTPIFWTYLAGVGLIGGGTAIILNIGVKLFASLLGIIIFIWFIILHIPRVVVSPQAYIGDEITSAFVALAYSGGAFVIAGRAKLSLNKN